MDHHWKDDIFATSGDEVNIWDERRTEPVRTFNWGVDSVSHVKFNAVEHHLLGATASDRGIMLYDMRGSTPLRKVQGDMCEMIIEFYGFSKQVIFYTRANIDGLVQDCSNSSALGMELLQSCTNMTKPSIYMYMIL